MPQVYPCESCHQIIDEALDKFVLVNHVEPASMATPRKGRVHAGCWEEYQKKYPESEPANSD